MEAQEHTLEWLLDYDGRRHFFCEVEKLCEVQGISTEVVEDKEA